MALIRFPTNAEWLNALLRHQRMKRVANFTELGIGKAFIAFPRDGDDSGHGGYRKPYRLFWKISNAAPPMDNAVATACRTPSSFPLAMEVIAVIATASDRCRDRDA